MTWASNGLSASLTKTGLFLKRQLWIWPFIALVVISILGFITKNLVESTIKGNLSNGLQSFVEIESEMLGKWFRVQQANANALANSQEVRQVVYELLHATELANAETTSTSQTALVATLENALNADMTSHDYIGYFLADTSRTVVASSHRSLVGQQRVAEYAQFLNDCFDGQTVVSPPFSSVVMLTDENGRSRLGQPTMFVAAPVRDQSFRVVGVLALQIRPEREFTGILQLGRIGQTGETYAFNEDGVMVSNSRFDEELILLGILPDRDDSRSMLNIMLRDPGGDMTEGFRPTTRRAKLPMTTMAADGIDGNADVNVEGYRDYRGVRVVGAWTWLPEYRIGVATEVDVAQAYRPLVILRRTFYLLMAMLGLASLAIFGFTIAVAHLQREAQKAAVEAQQLGQYTLEEKLGEGAMGVVYKGHHAMLRRPAAIKMLNLDNLNEASLSRFEREVQITCQLNHPNTIAIYDYGRTPEGVFYYAMEYLEGIDLHTLIDDYGPQPQSRVIHLLRQMCGSLFEAHSTGLVHRDVKPANTMIAQRGCQPDVVKVLDFGLVKALSDEAEDRSSSLTGTPLYMSPEAIQSPLSVDACSDIYAVGAVGYFLLTGKPVFEASNIAQLCKKHVDDDPIPPSQVVDNPVSDELEHAILACLEKRRAKRPQTARDLAQLLNRCPEAYAWTVDDGDAWWSRHERGIKQPSASSRSEPSQNDRTSLKAADTTSSETSALDRTLDH